MKLMLTLRSHPGVKAIEYLTPDGKHSVVRVGGWRRRKRVEVGGPVPRPDFGVGGPSAIDRLAAMMLVARLTGDEAIVPPGMDPSDSAAAFGCRNPYGPIWTKTRNRGAVSAPRGV